MLISTRVWCVFDDVCSDVARMLMSQDWLRQDSLLVDCNHQISTYFPSSLWICQTPRREVLYHSNTSQKRFSVAQTPHREVHLSLKHESIQTVKHLAETFSIHQTKQLERSTTHHHLFVLRAAPPHIITCFVPSKCCLSQCNPPHVRRDAVTNTTTAAIFTCNHFFTTAHSWIS
jgi:hypothetical protein